MPATDDAEPYGSRPLHGDGASSPSSQLDDDGWGAPSSRMRAPAPYDDADGELWLGWLHVQPLGDADDVELWPEWLRERDDDGELRQRFSLRSCGVACAVMRMTPAQSDLSSPSFASWRPATYDGSSLCEVSWWKNPALWPTSQR